MQRSYIVGRLCNLPRVGKEWKCEEKLLGCGGDGDGGSDVCRRTHGRGNRSSARSLSDTDYKPRPLPDNNSNNNNNRPSDAFANVWKNISAPSLYCCWNRIMYIWVCVCVCAYKSFKQFTQPPPETYSVLENREYNIIIIFHHAIITVDSENVFELVFDSWSLLHEIDLFRFSIFFSIQKSRLLILDSFHVNSTNSLWRGLYYIARVVEPIENVRKLDCGRLHDNSNNKRFESISYCLISHSKFELRHVWTPVYTALKGTANYLQPDLPFLRIKYINKSTPIDRLHTKSISIIICSDIDFYNSNNLLEIIILLFCRKLILKKNISRNLIK